MIVTFLSRGARLLLADWCSRMLCCSVLVPRAYRALVREIERVRAMKRRHKLLDEQYWASQIRKYAHIIDKGLRRSDCEPGHSTEWYRAAKEAFEMFTGEAVRADPSLTWAQTRLHEYEATRAGESVLGVCAPSGPVPEAYESLRRIIEARRSVRTYTTKDIDRETVLKVVEVINWAPSSCNRQPARVFLTTSRPLVGKCMQTCSGATCFSASAPCFISFCADLRVYDLPEEMLMAELDLGLGIQNCLMVAHTLGLSMTLLSWARHTRRDEEALRRLLNIPSYCHIVVNALMGYPAVGCAPPGRKPLAATCVIVD